MPWFVNLAGTPFLLAGVDGSSVSVGRGLRSSCWPPHCRPGGRRLPRRLPCRAVLPTLTPELYEGAGAPRLQAAGRWRASQVVHGSLPDRVSSRSAWLVEREMRGSVSLSWQVPPA